MSACPSSARTAASETAGGPAWPGAEQPTWDELYQEAVSRLGAAREARWMVEEASGEHWGVARGPAPERAARRMRSMVQRRLAGEPLQYVIGSWSFRRLDLMVDRRVLIPRPETEQVVEVALAEIDRVGRSREDVVRVVDLGTGSGAIALSVAAERPGTEVWATDLSGPALEVARANLAGLAGFAATRVTLAEGRWWEALPPGRRGSFDIVVSNPPYLSSAEMVALAPEIREWEPGSALEAGPTGTEAVADILAGAPEWLSDRGVAVIEIAPHQASQVEGLARGAGFGEVFIEADLAGRPRALVARLGPNEGGGPKL